MPPSPLSPSPSPQEVPVAEAHTLLTSFNEFLIVSTHTILYYRRIYPEHTFLSSNAYNLPVHQSRHPKVCDWVRDAADAVSAQLAAGAAERVAVVIHAPPPSGKPSDGGGAVLERWVFDVSHFPAWPGGVEAMRAFEEWWRLECEGEDDSSGGEGAESEYGAEEDEEDEKTEDGADGRRSRGNKMDDGGGGGSGDDEDEDDDDEDDEDNEGVVNWADVDEQLRAMVKRLAHTGEKLSPLPSGCTFTVAIELRDDGEPPIGVGHVSSRLDST